jgi:hypothetical protein
MRQRGLKHRYPDRPAQRFRGRPRGPSPSRTGAAKFRSFSLTADKLLRSEPHGLIAAA